jgi:hypothetical protein
VAWLGAALKARSLDWQLREFDTEKAAWAAWDARDAWDAWAAWAAWAARDARAAWDAWAARDAWDARDAWAAWDALTVSFAARSGWITHKHDLLSIGIRDAYRNGLAIAVPTGPNELGWAMEAV